MLARNNYTPKLVENIYICFDLMELKIRRIQVIAVYLLFSSVEL